MKYSINSFIKIADKFVSIADVHTSLPDPRYIDGAIVWTIGEDILLSEDHWDLVDQLWAYIVNGLPVLKERGEYATYFPDQPLRLAFKQLGRERIEVIVGDSRYIVPSAVFFASLVEGGRDFFSRMQAVRPAAATTWRKYLSELDIVAAP